MAVECISRLATTAAWGLQFFEAPMPGVLLSHLWRQACQRWQQETGWPWKSRSRNARRKRTVLPAELPDDCAEMLAQWLVSSASQVNWSNAERQVLARPIAEHLLDLRDAGFGYAPPRTGELRIHRDSDDGFTVLIALDQVIHGGGTVAFLPYSDRVQLPEHRLTGLPRTWPHPEFEFTASEPGVGCLFRASTLHWGRANVSAAGRIIINATLGSTLRVRVQDARDQVSMESDPSAAVDTNPPGRGSTVRRAARKTKASRRFRQFKSEAPRQHRKNVSHAQQF